MDPPELASEPPRSRIGAASNSAPHLTPLGWVMLGVCPSYLHPSLSTLWMYVSTLLSQHSPCYIHIWVEGTWGCAHSPWIMTSLSSQPKPT